MIFIRASIFLGNFKVEIFFLKVVHYFFDFVFVDSFPTACFKTSVCHFCLCLPKYRLSVEKKTKLKKKKLL